ncbi:hypothetical protein E8K88_15860 [Lampropedia aestuarii]|uniref:Uncharacterized protein n=1 Tax=Lampropedia aestuarii TaxID=2562762 RepID=A0A4S5BN02_9BURK|nr:hypothetical protein [Lampropedia aestuarii]THJ31118.1 hypothetical protein E8K88_15860 [Lampropedia aestuarii]
MEIYKKIKWPAYWVAGVPSATILSREDLLCLIYEVSEFPAANIEKLHRVEIGNEKNECNKTWLLSFFNSCLMSKYSAFCSGYFDDFSQGRKGLSYGDVHIGVSTEIVGLLKKVGNLKDDYRHYLFSFHDEIFECAATPPEFYWACCEIQEIVSYAECMMRKYFSA